MLEQSKSLVRIVGLLIVVAIVTVNSNVVSPTHSQMAENTTIINATTLPNGTTQLNGTSVTQEDKGIICEMPIFRGSSMCQK